MTVGVVTVGRSDYGLLRPILRRVASQPDMELMLIVSGSHLPDSTARWIEEDGFLIAERVDMLLASDTAEGIAKSMGLGVLGFGALFGRRRPDLLVVLGDRFETYAAALAALPFQLPVAHIHGGELTLGAFDDALRHSITKLSHLHFVAHSAYGQRVMQLGEEPWRVVVSGSPGIDAMRETGTLDRSDFRSRFGFDLPAEFALATFHPVTLESSQLGQQCSAWLEALDACGLPVVFTAPNADPGHGIIRDKVGEFVASHGDARLAHDLGPIGYYTAMRFASVMVGNSSSGLIEAPWFHLPVVNVGNRQRGRLRGRGVIDCEAHAAAISAAIGRAGSQEFRDSLRDAQSLYGNGHATEGIVDNLRLLGADPRLLQKQFQDWPVPSAIAAMALV